MEIKINNLSKSYKNHVVLDNINATFDKPGIYLIAGPNGSGKTTLLEILVGLRKPTSGDVLVNSVSPDSILAKKSLGFLSQQNSLRKNCYVYEELRLVADLFDIHDVDLKNYLKKYDLEQYYHHKTRKLSGGSKRRLLLAMTLLPKQEIIILDEPASGLDSFSRNEIWNIITEISKNRVVIVSDHYLNQAAQYSDYVYLMNNAKVILHGDLKKVMSTLNKSDVIKVRKDKRENIENQLKKLQIDIDSKVSGTVYSYYISATDKLKLAGISFADCNVSAIDFEDIYFYYTGKYSYDGGDYNA